ncbi:MAG: SGNH/GDSL hydrolase family protein [Candidatus Thiodiazotropha taylori]|nr:SGNH/GDSL hydrolase family protein [Candidatus Thiodiazotropha taylori]MCW4286016.1 SGNH/GDSL hydrolase family protein [Candidatus Thiodiazotropha taylori]
MAESRGLLNLGINSKKVVWLGTRGMRWEQIRQKFQLMMIENPQPAMILIHLGGNDLAFIKQAKLMRAIKRDIQYIASVFPSTQIVWSDILPRKSWRGVVTTTINLYKLDQKRKRINRASHQIVRNFTFGKVIVHEIDTTPGLFKPDGVHLSYIGNAIFLNTIQEALLTFFTNATQNMYDAN